MTDPYVTFDTFTVGGEPNKPVGEPAPRPSLLARLPRVAPAPPKPKRVQRFDEAEPAARGAHLHESGGGLAFAGPATLDAPRRLPLADPTATIRIDTVAPGSFQEAAPRTARPASRVAPAAAPAPEPVEDPWATWLIQLESAILPYSRVIVLAAAIAAMGLTLVLMRGGKPTESGGGAPQVSATTPIDSLAATGEAGQEAPLYWPATPASAELQPITPPAASLAPTAPPAAFAAGPASAWRGPAGARLTGEAIPADQPRVQVAANPDSPNTTR